MPTFTEDIHLVPGQQVQVLRALGCVAVLGHHLVEHGPAPGALDPQEAPLRL